MHKFPETRASSTRGVLIYSYENINSVGPSASAVPDPYDQRISLPDWGGDYRRPQLILEGREASSLRGQLHTLVFTFPQPRILLVKYPVESPFHLPGVKTILTSNKTPSSRG